MDRCIQFISVVGTVVHADHCHRLFSCLISRIKERCNFSDVTLRSFWSAYKVCLYIRKQFSFSVYKAVSLFCNRKCHHLQRVFCKDLFQTCKIRCIFCVDSQRLYHTSDYCFLNVSICFECHKNCVIIMRMVHFFHDLIVKSLCNDQTAIQNAVIQQVLYYICLKCTENISRTEMDPERIFFCRFCHFFSVKFWKGVSRLFPFCSVFQSFCT